MIKKVKLAKGARRTYTGEEIERFVAINSKRLPLAVEMNGRRLEWCGFGWIDVGEPTGKEPLVLGGGKLESLGAQR